MKISKSDSFVHHHRPSSSVGCKKMPSFAVEPIGIVSPSSALVSFGTKRRCIYLYARNVEKGMDLRYISFSRSMLYICHQNIELLEKCSENRLVETSKRFH